MYLLSLRLAPSPWVGTRCSPTAQYTVPSVSTQTMTPRRVGFFDCACAPPRAEPAGPSVWCTMMLRQGCDLARSPHGASQTIFRPGISGVPDERAIVARSGVCAEAETENASAQSAVANNRAFIFHGPVDRSSVTRSRVLAQAHLRQPLRCGVGHQRRRRVIGRKAVAAGL